MLLVVSLKSHLQILDICYERLGWLAVVGLFCLCFVMTLFVFNCLACSAMSVIQELIIHSFSPSDINNLGDSGGPAWGFAVMVCSDN